MRPDLANKRRALVLGGSGAIGSAVLRELARREVPATFTYFKNQERADVLAAEFGHRAVRADFSSAEGIEKFFAELDEDIDVLVHCAGVSASIPVTEIDSARLRETLAINAEAPLLACRWLARRHDQLPSNGADVVFVGALDRGQSLPLPVHFAASQGMLSAMTMALGHELGPQNIRVNMITLGVMDGGMSADLASDQRRDYERFSSLRRVGTADEAAKAITWLALENSYIQGRVLPVNGGI